MIRLALAAFLFLFSLPAFAQPGRGLAVVALPGGTDAARPLAQEIYGNANLRPAFDETRARILIGEAPAEGAPKDLTDLAETVRALKGDDAPTRQLLQSMGQKLGVRAIVLVDPQGPKARVFAPDTGTFDAASYAPDEGKVITWKGAATSLARSFATVQAPPASVRETPPARPSEKPKKFYESAWFWGAIGAAAFLGGAIYFATRDNAPSTIHLQAQVPR